MSKKVVKENFGERDGPNFKVKELQDYIEYRSMLIDAVEYFKTVLGYVPVYRYPPAELVDISKKHVDQKGEYMMDYVLYLTREAFALIQFLKEVVGLSYTFEECKFKQIKNPLVKCEAKVLGESIPACFSYTTIHAMFSLIENVKIHLEK